jgi:hypothetical protein
MWILGMPDPRVAERLVVEPFSKCVASGEEIRFKFRDEKWSQYSVFGLPSMHDSTLMCFFICPLNFVH